MERCGANTPEADYLVQLLASENFVGLIAILDEAIVGAIAAGVLRKMPAGLQRSLRLGSGSHAWAGSADSGSTASSAHITKPEVATAFTAGPDSEYLNRLQLAQLRAKTGLALQGVSRAAARMQSHDVYVAVAADFAPNELAVAPPWPVD